ncbi:hypothetical protein EVAR_69917_1 [Eumeta japonica]|uniref:Uncharacterized protein n=1 Tax=Eumeta variegata TaxID=151549 RepID=A0A4C1T1U9_EUMVA|nr:hypothetical protein EVAR_69917_1 [Eumeta japonica]
MVGAAESRGGIKCVAVFDTGGFRSDSWRKRMKNKTEREKLNCPITGYDADLDVSGENASIKMKYDGEYVDDA